MIATKEKEGIYLSSFMELEERLAASGPSWLREIRRAAMESFAEKGFPTTRQEEWRNTNVAPIAAVPFQPAGEAPTGSAESMAERISRLPLADLGCPRLVFINGRFSKQLSTLEALPKGMKVGSLAEALASDGKTLEGHLSRYATDYSEHAFVASEHSLPRGRGIPRDSQGRGPREAHLPALRIRPRAGFPRCPIRAI